MIRTIRLLGPLAKQFGDEPIRFKANTLGDVIRAVDLARPGFITALREYPHIAFFKKDEDKVVGVPQEELQFNLGKWPEVAIATSVDGSYFPGAEAVYTAMINAGYSTIAAYAVAAVYVIAMTVAFSELMQSLYEVPQQEAAAKEVKSTLFNGPENRNTQGGRVQLVYGKFRVGSYTLNQNMQAIRVGVAAQDSLTVTEGTTETKNVFANDYHTEAPTVTSFTVNGSSSISAGGTYNSTSPTGVDITVASTGLVTVVAGTNTGGATFSVAITAADGTTDISQTLNILIASYYVPDTP